MSGNRSVIRDAVVTAFENLKKQETARVPEFNVARRWLTETEVKGASTYCVVATDERPAAQTQQQDTFELVLVVVIWSHDTKDPRVKLDAMIEDCFDAMRAAWNGAMREVAWMVRLEELTTDEGTAAAGPWAQAVLRWTVSHRRATIQS